MSSSPSPDRATQVRILQGCIEELREERDLYARTLAQANRLYDQKLRELRTVQRFSEILRNVQSMRQVCTGIVDTIVEELGAENCSLMCLDRAIGRLTIRAARGQSDKAGRYFDQADAPISFTVGEGVAGWVAQTSQPLLVPDVSSDPRFKPFEAPEPSVRSLLCLPLVEADQVWGVLNLSHSNLNAFTEDNERILSIVAGQAAVALANVQLFSQLQRMNEALEETVTSRTRELREKAGQLAVINQIAKTVNAATDPEQALGQIAGQIHRLVPFDIFCVALPTQAGSRMRTINITLDGTSPSRDVVAVPPRGSMLDRALESQAFVFHDVDISLLQLVGGGLLTGGMLVPLVVDERARGAMTLVRRAGNQYTPAQLKLLVDLAEHIAVALEKSRLYKALERMNEELEVTVAERTRELADSETYYRTLFEQSTDGIFLLDDSGHVCQANSRWLRLVAASGDTHDLQVTVDPGKPPLTLETLANSVPETGKSFDTTKFVRPDGEVRYFDLHLTPVVLLSRRHVLGVAHDTTERHMLEEQLLRTEKLAAMGTLAASVAHEINNPLEGIKNCLNVLRNRLPAGGVEIEMLDQVSKGFVRIRDIVRQILDFHRPGTQVHSPVDINSAVTEVVNLFRNDLKGRNIELRLELSSGLPCVYGSAGRLQQVFTNVLVNASEAIDAPGSIVVRSFPRDSDVIVEIADTGCGMSPADVDAVFQPFFTNKRSGKGTGLGLWISHSVVREHGGWIGVQSAPGRGTTMTISLPATGVVP